MPVLSDYAVIDVNYYKLYAGYELDDTNINDDELNQFINQASRLMEQEANRAFRSSTATEVFHGNGTVNYMVRQKRITTLTTLHYWDGTAWEAVASPTYEFDSVESTGLIYFTDGNVFHTGNQNWKVVYVYGWDLASIPEELKLCCCEIVEWLKQLRKKSGIASETLGDKSISYKAENSKMPESAKEILFKYRSYRYA